MIALGYFFALLFFINWVIRYVLNQILVILETNFNYNFGKIKAIDRRNQSQEKRLERQDLYNHIY